ncbi:MAG TPA: DUF4388 domain-containing protein [Myxococcales bacterium]|jgi:hypothetical protein
MADPRNTAWKLLSGSSDLLGALREGHAVEAQPHPRGTVLAGDLAEMQPSDLLNFLHQGRRTGVLLTRTHEVERAVVLTEGNVAWACSTSPGERIGELLANMGLVGRERVEAALRDQQASKEKKRLGQLLVDRGQLGPDEVWRGLKHQVVEIFLGLLVTQSGSFVFLRGVEKAKLPAQLSLDTQGMLLDGLRRLDEMELYRTRVPSLESKPKPTGTAPSTKLSLEEQRVLSLANGVRTLGELSAMTCFGEFETTKAVFKLIEGGYLSL